MDRKQNMPEHAELSPGRPGYRTREGRSGYDPLETQQEAGYMAGLLLRAFFRWVRRHIRRR